MNTHKIKKIMLKRHYPPIWIPYIVVDLLIILCGVSWLFFVKEYGNIVTGIVIIIIGIIILLIAIYDYHRKNKIRGNFTDEQKYQIENCIYKFENWYLCDDWFIDMKEAVAIAYSEITCVDKKEWFVDFFTFNIKRNYYLRIVTPKKKYSFNYGFDNRMRFFPDKIVSEIYKRSENCTNIPYAYVQKQINENNGGKK